MKNLYDYIKEYADAGKAIGHFNVATLEMLHGVINAGIETGEPVIIGVSEGERDFMGVSLVSAIVNTIRKEKNLPVFLNADHTYPFERVKEVIQAGYDSVIFDGASLSLEENIATAKKCVQFAKEEGKKLMKEILVEGEIGYIGQSSKILTEVPKGAAVNNEEMTTPEEALRYVDETGVHLLAPAIGNVHGVIVGIGNPKLNIKRAEEIKNTVKIPMVLHGGSGIKDEDVQGAVKAGCSVVHFSTDLRVAYRASIIKAFGELPDEIAPYKYLKLVQKEIQKVVVQKIKLISNK